MLKAVNITDFGMDDIISPYKRHASVEGIPSSVCVTWYFILGSNFIVFPIKLIIKLINQK